eukprot:scaffold5307_cov159-Ochromonas_danica.AAC.2
MLGDHFDDEEWFPSLITHYLSTQCTDVYLRGRRKLCRCGERWEQALIFQSSNVTIVFPEQQEALAKKRYRTK